MRSVHSIWRWVINVWWFVVLCFESVIYCFRIEGCKSNLSKIWAVKLIGRIIINNNKFTHKDRSNVPWVELISKLMSKHRYVTVLILDHSKVRSINEHSILFCSQVELVCSYVIQFNWKWNIVVFWLNFCTTFLKSTIIISIVAVKAILRTCIWIHLVESISKMSKITIWNVQIWKMRTDVNILFNILHISHIIHEEVGCW